MCSHGVSWKDFGEGRAALGSAGCWKPLRRRLGVRIGWEHVRRVKAMARLQFVTANLQYHCKTQGPRDLWTCRCGQRHGRYFKGLIYALIPFISSGKVYVLLLWEHLETSPPSGIFTHRRALAMKRRAVLCRDPRTAQASSWASDQAALLSLSPHGLSVLRGISFPRVCTRAFLTWLSTLKERGSMYSLTIVPISRLFSVLSS